jgi:hypothetical protein
VRRLELRSEDELASVDLERDGDAVAQPLVLVCGHGSRDACCALRGTAVFSALAPFLPEESLWLSSHQGGHRFATNVLVLPTGLQFGRLESDEAPDVVSRALSGAITLDRYRGRTYYEAVVQAAEHAVRTTAAFEGSTSSGSQRSRTTSSASRSWTGRSVSRSSSAARDRPCRRVAARTRSLSRSSPHGRPDARAHSSR